MYCTRTTNADNEPALPPFRRCPDPEAEGHLQGWRGSRLRQVPGSCAGLRRTASRFARAAAAATPTRSRPAASSSAGPAITSSRVTSGTIFAAAKSPSSICWRRSASSPTPRKASQRSNCRRDVDVQYKTAWVLAHKIREALAPETQRRDAITAKSKSTAAYVGGKIRPANLKPKRIDRRLAEHQTGKRRVVIALRQRKGRTLTFVRRAEPKASRSPASASRRPPSFTPTKRAIGTISTPFSRSAAINHSEAYSRTASAPIRRRAISAAFAGWSAASITMFSPQYLHQYAAHAAWLEDHRRESNGALAGRIVRNAMAAPVSRKWKGYWQRKAA